ncbi:DGPFAETKE family protein [Streptomonospora alba]|uniref:DGPFAETKE family protein n=1 Tax=Streptomonospora alba TaxID=183763 RepID=A0A0C2G614_9ACTN|nr:YciI family protein [Streptomonospora alba]KIH98733.1 DGPFAETKE family protein [Streptomonospora alba]
MAHYLLSIYQPDGPAPDAEALDPIMRDVEAVNEEMRDAGAWVFAAGLHEPATATVVRARGDDVGMTDGPYLEGKEHIGGFTVVEAEDLDAALEWGRKLSRATTLPIEVRPMEGGSCG